MLTSARTASKSSPSASSDFVGLSCQTPASPITKGATLMTPRASEANQFHQVIRNGVPELWKRMNPVVPPTPESRSPDRRRCKKAKHVSHLVESELWAEMTIDQPCDENGFAGIAKGEDHSCREIAVAHQIGNDRCAP